MTKQYRTAVPTEPELPAACRERLDNAETFTLEEYQKSFVFNDFWGAVAAAR